MWCKNDLLCTCKSLVEPVKIAGKGKYTMMAIKMGKKYWENKINGIN